MKLLLKSFATICVCILVAGCVRPAANSSPDLGGPNGTITWAPPDGKDNPLPGIDQGNIYHLGTAFVVWCDTAGGGGGSSSSNAQGVKCQGTPFGRAGRRVEFACETKDGKAGRVAINGATFELADGNLFVVATDREQPRVKQLKRDLSGLKFERASLEAFGRNDAEILGFFTEAAKPK
jgi:hypothetical protein